MVSHIIILTLASLWIIITFISTRSQYQRIAALGSENATFMPPASSLQQKRQKQTTSSRTDHHHKTLLLHKSDPLYRNWNMSTTPIVIEKYKLLFFTTEKIGSTVLKQLLRRMMGYTNYDYQGEGIPHVSPQNGLIYITDYDLGDANDMMMGGDWTRAMFVRDPKERALSAFLMWRPHRVFLPEMLQKAQNGQINETMVNATIGLGKCCIDRANGDGNYEVLCLDHVRTFEGFLDMIEDPANLFGDSNSSSTYLKGTRSEDSSSARWSPNNIRRSPSCIDKHWSPVSHWRLNPKFYPQLNFIGHLETAQDDIKRLLDILHPDAWRTYGASGWGKFRNESMFQSSSTIFHANKAVNHLSEYYTNEEIERRVEHIYKADYDNKYLDLARIPISHAKDFYHERVVQRYAELLDEIKALVKLTKPGKAADDLLAAYAGREEELAMHLRQMRARQDFKAEVEALVAKTKPGKTTDELLAAYVGRGDELVTHLQKLSASK